MRVEERADRCCVDEGLPRLRGVDLVALLVGQLKVIRHIRNRKDARVDERRELFLRGSDPRQVVDAVVRDGRVRVRKGRAVAASSFVNARARRRQRSSPAAARSYATSISARTASITKSDTLRKILAREQLLKI